MIETNFDKLPITKVTEAVKPKFIQIYNQKYDPFCLENAIATGGKGAVFYEEQEALFNTEIKNGPYAKMLVKAKNENLANAFLSLAINGLSLEKTFTTECYLECRSVNVGTREQPVYISLPKISITGYGEVKMRVRAGQIAGIENPVVVYDCDDLRVGEKDGHKYVNYEKCFVKPGKARIIACYMKILLNSGGFDYFVLDLDGIKRLAGYSAKFNYSNKPNALYVSNDGQIDTGFLIAKTIKHAFKGYPKLSIGDGAVYQSDDDMLPDNSPREEKKPDGVVIEQEDDTPF